MPRHSSAVIRNFGLLYAVGHHGIAAIGSLLGVFLVAAVGEGHHVPVPWLNGLQGMNLGALCAVGYALIPLGVFHTELSRLEALSPRRWWLVDALLTALFWALPWAGTAVGAWDAHFAYCTSGLLVLAYSAGVVARVDTVTVGLVGVLLAQTALWGSLFDSRGAMRSSFSTSRRRR